MPRELEVSIWRGGESGRFQTFRLPVADDSTVLDLVTAVQREHDSTLAYRFACRVGMCGSCAMRVNGRARWTCRTLVRDAIEADRLVLQPLANLPVVKDLVCEMGPFFDKWRRAQAVFLAGESTATTFAAVPPDDPRRRLVDAAIECINCGCCESSCDTVSGYAHYLGPAALNRAWTLQNDERDAGFAARLDAVAQAGGCQNCRTHHRCAAHCPVGLNPAASIAGLKRLVAMAALRRRR